MSELLNLKKFNLLKDIYYDDEYIKLYLKDNEEIFSFEYKDGDKIFSNKAIKRPIAEVGNKRIESKYYDLETAYGYGGFYSNIQDYDFISTAITKYKERCLQENIIAEFIRFHPFNNFPINHSSFLDLNINNRKVITKDLTQDILSGYPSKVRNAIKRASEKVTIQKSININQFVELYNNTMKKNNAEDFYYFDEVYYEKLLKDPRVELYEVLYEKKIVAMAFFMYGENIGHYHLSANSDLSYQLNSNYALLHHAFITAKHKGLSSFLLGGGTTDLEDDPLLRFKKKFSKEYKNFYIGGKIYNPTIYEEYNNLWGMQTDKKINYFLKYRLGL